MKTRGVGSITLGFVLIITGVLLILQLFVEVINYRFILQLWPLILIFLGFEVLLSYLLRHKAVPIYDKTALFFLMAIVMFALAITVTDWCLNHVLAGMFFM